jgi:hypothetical protein
MIVKGHPNFVTTSYTTNCLLHETILWNEICDPRIVPLNLYSFSQKSMSLSFNFIMACIIDFLKFKKKTVKWISCTIKLIIIPQNFIISNAATKEKLQVE